MIAIYEANTIFYRKGIFYFISPATIAELPVCTLQCWRLKAREVFVDGAR